MGLSGERSVGVQGRRYDRSVGVEVELGCVVWRM